MILSIPKLGFKIEVEDDYKISQEESYWLIDNFRIYEIEFIKNGVTTRLELVDNRYPPIHDYTLVNGRKMWL